MMSKTRSRGVKAAIIIAGLLAAFMIGQFVTMSGYVGDLTEQWYTPSQEASYIIGQYNSTFYYLQNHTGYGLEAYDGYEYESSNATYVWDMAKGNCSTGGHIHFKAGTYAIRQLTINVDNLTVTGEAGTIITPYEVGIEYSQTWSSYFINPSATSTLNCTPVVLIRDCKNVVVSGLTVDDDGTYKQRNRDAFFVWNSWNVLIEKCRAYDIAGAGFRVRSDGTYDCGNPSNSTLRTGHITIRDCIAQETKYFAAAGSGQTVKGFGYMLDYCEDVKVEDCLAYNTQESSYRTQGASGCKFINNNGTVTGTSVTYLGEPFDVWKTDNLLIQGNNIYTPLKTPAVWLYGYLEEIRIDLNHFNVKAADYPIRLKENAGDEGSRYVGIWITNNWLNDNVGVYCGEDVHINGNTFNLSRTETRYALRVHNSSTVGLKYLEFKGNTVLNAHFYAVYVDADILFNVTYLSVSENHFVNCSSGGADVIFYEANSVNCTLIAANYFEGTGSAQCVDIQATPGLIYGNVLDIHSNDASGATMGDNIGWS